MKCDQIRAQLSAYLDGDLDGDRGSAVRGHLRECSECRRISADEAALRDGLRALPTLDPSPSLWAGVQARLASAEVADAKRPAWRRQVTRWRAMFATYARHFVIGGGLAAAAITTLWWRGRAPEPAPNVAVLPLPIVPPAPDGTDVTADLAGEAARIAADYAQAATELVTLAEAAREHWSIAQRTSFDVRVVALRADITTAGDDGRAARKAWRALIRFLQVAVARDEVAMVSVRGMP